MLTTLIAVLIALMLVNVIEPGVQDGQPVRDKLALTANAGEVTAGVMSRADTSVLDSIRGDGSGEHRRGRRQHQDARR